METDSRLIAFKKLLDIMDELRVKCPWDSKQTFDSLRYLTIEETYELSDAIIDKKYTDIGKELGDLMLHIVFYSKLGQEQNLFDIETVLNGISEKLIRRHPHIFGDVKVQSAAEVKENWEKIKLTEGNKSVLSGVPKSLPAMVKSYRIQEKARGVGFDWENADQVWSKVMEEMNEFRAEVDLKSDRMEDEFGDLLFALINYARFIEINPEDALEKTNRKFIQRFMHIENRAKDLGKSITDMDLEEMETYWQEAKIHLK
ncbi:MAG TPA: nucleoside triphosphate pyrophosphohydrolase [Bacteroidales bacterium]|jgi:XTP/dITP diphosphohydrolase|nr:nucleoside triphosphate pyrophosphohydrolase [Bacteroidales bacterium]HPS71365.1 nucleoside triphosphate pyrophosphohydrolase [Bacteroidales bacterium]